MVYEERHAAVGLNLKPERSLRKGRSATQPKNKMRGRKRKAVGEEERAKKERKMKRDQRTPVGRRRPTRGGGNTFK